VSGYVFMMEFTTTRIDDVLALSRAMAEERGEDAVPFARVITADRDRPGIYVTLSRFASLEAARTNGADPVTRRYAEAMGALLDGEPIFRNLDVLYDTDL
jgi:hypothetical protein